MVRLITVAVAGLLSFSAMSSSPDFYFKRFKIVRDGEKVTMIKDRSLSFKFSIRPYLKFVKKQLKEEQSLMNSKSDYSSEVASLFEHDMLEKGQRDNGQVQIVVDSLNKLRDLDIDGVFADPGFNEVVKRYEARMQVAMNKLDPTVLANLENPTFFYRKAVTYQVVKWGLDFAKKRLSQIPVLNTASYVLVQVEKLLREQRTFHQNMLMHYLENFGEEELQLTHEEVNKVYSSIYESRIPWFAFWESQAAVAGWDKYGVNKFFTNVRLANTNLRKQRSLFDNVGKRINFSFQEATYKGEEVLLNLFNNENMFNKRLAISWYVNKPQKVARKRSLLQLAQLGLSFVSLPSWVKSFAEGYMKSHYEAQKITEGALFGYFEANGMRSGMERVKAQYLNPFDQLILEDSAY